MSDSRYFVWCPQEGAPTVRHDSVESARDEAKRLCQMRDNMGKEYYVLRAIELIKCRTDPFDIKVFAKR